LGGFDYEVSVFHAIRSNGEGQPEYQHIFSSKEYTKTAGKEIASTLITAQNKLIDMGLTTDKVSTQIGEKAISRAGAIVDRAKQEDFGTIVMGRRGHSHVRDFFIGRVTNKVIHIARDRTVWLIR
jgi:nucleotide-binding universal stress UspA family protein